MMNKQLKNIKLLEDGSIQFKTRRAETPKNEIVEITDGIVKFKLNRGRIGFVNISDYFRLSLWAHRLTYDHAQLGRGVISYDNGYEHKSLAAAIMQTIKGKKVTYQDKNSLNCCRDNLVIKDNNYLLLV
jgi:hypothetical protein